ncbi:DUF4168 domain-containing protein [Phenylobacterium sp. LjRoot225]|uniref:DUF4168 domain-containing protein n=1 Tax=Phenylobacterium sp. LjRoot225 TaxID=3342285 RepID=UPI003ECF1831
MWRRTLLPVAVITALALATAAAAQETAAPATSAPPAYSDSRMQDFARATVELQALGDQDPAAMTRAIEGAGMNVEDYNSMGDAMRADPALAASLYPYLDTANLERTARVTRLATQGLDRRWSPPKRKVAATKTSRRSHAKARSHKRKAAASRQHATKRKGHAAASKPAARHRQRKG